MMLDKLNLFANGLAHDGTVTAVDMESTKPGNGNPIKCFATGASIAGATGLAITDCDTLAGSYTAVDAITCTAAEINAGIEFALPSNVRRYVKVDLAGSTSAGTWTSGVILPGFQTNV